MKHITIGMATYRDFHGVYFTLEALCLYHRPGVDVELIVIDNWQGKQLGRALAARTRARLSRTSAAAMCMAGVPGYVRIARPHLSRGYRRGDPVSRLSRAAGSGSFAGPDRLVRPAPRQR